ncbi:hypothetical protein SAICODRAFT_73741 [Saitoella complicata NRRL Y-17804]|uniref:uncharacterized protein n=1 Tax=Saitoella complicata (strain BCRC 22490 / CBS 7301 / JCM 7358 / NBRC 10748 / NRRL Y-17804) TaxID=698492 RepID=UPI00086814C9|nr:uncharacterized protein SAICODRAFT_73741 [Saitoella complicata NRRL Y-17804]ODQ49990.1 hypothetical protein SAICODRAFT_73741 [Saitoella complicata NRRL Y-17804]
MDDDLSYLQAGFDPATLRVADLRRILLEWDVQYPSSAKKAVLVDIFSQSITPNAAKYLKKKEKARATKAGSPDVYAYDRKVKIESTSEVEPGQEETPMVRRKSRRSLSPRKAMQPVSEEEEISPPPTATRRKSVKIEKPVLAVETRTPARRKSSKLLNEGEKDDVDTFSPHNPFQSPPPAGLEGGRRKTLAEGTASSKRKSLAATTPGTQNRRRTDLGPILALAPPEARVPARFMPSVNTLQTSTEFRELVNQVEEENKDSDEQEPEITEEFTPDEVKELQATPDGRKRLSESRAEARRLMKRRKVKKSGPSVWPKVLLGALVAPAVAYGAWWREEKVNVGYCGVDTPEHPRWPIPEALQPYEQYDPRPHLRPECVPCPDHAVCYPNFKAVCEPDFVEVLNPLSLNGLIPLPPACEPDSEKLRKVMIVADEAVQQLRNRNAAEECGHVKLPKGEPKGLNEEDLKAELYKLKSPALTDEQFENLWQHALNDVVDREEVTVTHTDGNNRIFSSSSLANISFGCAIRKSIRGSLARHRGALISVVLLALGFLYLRSFLIRRRKYSRRVEELVHYTLRQLSDQRRFNISNPEATPVPYVAVGQLRDLVLAGEFDPKERQRLWLGVQKVVEGNSNIRVRQLEVNGEIHRCWEWVSGVSFAPSEETTPTKVTGKEDEAVDAPRIVAAVAYEERSLFSQGGPWRMKDKNTQTTKRHRFKPFSKRVEGVKIDVYHRVNRQVQHEEAEECFFKTALESWTELNLTTTFTQFLREVRPLSNTLVQVLYHKEKIFELLEGFLKKGDELALEPLLDLITQFARDLGTEYEPFFARSITALFPFVRSGDLEVIEHTFNCLAFLLKYLAKQLVPDLRPVFDLLSPLLGKKQQKYYTTRFAAEAFAFLIRRARGEHLKIIVKHALADLAANPSDLYSDGLCTIFTESIKSVEMTLHSRATAIFEQLLECVHESETQEGRALVKKVEIALLHHSQRQTFTSIFDVVCNNLSAALEATFAPATRVIFAVDLAYTLAAVRKGTRVSDWPRIADLAARAVSSKTPEVFWPAAQLAAVFLQYAELGLAAQKCDSLFTPIFAGEDVNAVLAFCDYLGQSVPERFRDLALPYFVKFVAQRWEAAEQDLLVTLPRLKENGVFRTGTVPNKNLSNTGLLQLNQEKGLVPALLKKLSVSKELTIAFHEQDEQWFAQQLARLEALKCIHVTPAAIKPVVQQLGLVLLEKGQGSKTVAPVLGAALTIFAQHLTENDQSIVQLVADNLNQWTSVISFLEGAKAVFAAASSKKGLTVNNVEQGIIDPLLPILALPSKSRRSVTLEILASAYSFLNKGKISEHISACQLVEDAPLTVESVRTVQMQLRNLAQNYFLIPKQDWVGQVFPRLCLGVLTLNFTALWGDACKALTSVAQQRPELVWDLVWEGLQTTTQPTLDDAPEAEEEEPVGQNSTTTSVFQCFNLANVTEISEKSLSIMKAGTAEVKNLYVKKFVEDSTLSPMARSQALRVLLGVPELAEKHNAQLVPLFIDCNGTDAVAVEEGDAMGVDAEITKESWSRKDKNTMLELFAKFKNPRTLSKTDTVREILMNLLAMGDNHIQTLALNCLLTWKEVELRTYEDNLKNLLDDTRFRDEITLFLHLDQRDSTIQEAHRGVLMPVVVRILFGRVVARRGQASQKKGLASRRTTILAALANLPRDDLKSFLDLVLTAFKDLDVIKKSDADHHVLRYNQADAEEVPERKQVGYVTMLAEIMEQLGTIIGPFTEELLTPLVYCLYRAHTRIRNQEQTESEGSVELKIARNIRQVGLKCLTALFKYSTEFTWQPYVPLIFKEFVSPRLEKLPIESSQNPSGLLQLLATWASSVATVLYLAEYDTEVVPNVLRCLTNKSVKPEVITYILNMLQKVLDHVDDSETEEDVVEAIKDKVLIPNLDLALDSVTYLLENEESAGLKGDLLELLINVLSRLAPMVSAGDQAQKLVGLLMVMLDKPKKAVSEKVKTDVLEVVKHFLPLCEDFKPAEPVFQKRYKTISSLFASLATRNGRLVLSQVFEVFGAADEILLRVVKLIVDLNSFSKKRLDEPDFNRRLKAFAEVNENLFSELTLREWLPLLHNALFNIQDKEELALRSSASFTLRRFAEVVGAADDEQRDKRIEVLNNVVMKEVRRGMRNPNELVRAEYLSVLAHVVRHCSFWDQVGDMEPLLFGNDEEANFFNNILHIQQHRRLRALRRLAVSASKGIHPQNIAHLFMPLIEHFVMLTGEKAEVHGLIAETVKTIGVLSGWLTWAQYKAVLKRYIGMLKGDVESERTTIRLISAVVDGIAGSSNAQASTAEDAESDADGEDVDMADAGEVEEIKPSTALLSSLPPVERLQEEVLNGLLPPLVKYLHTREESTVILRVPVALPIVKLLRLLPEEVIANRLPGVLMDLSHVLKSKSQESRDMTRKTLADIVALLGPAYFQYVLTELRGALLRGSQLHVLGFTVHTLLVRLTENKQITKGDLDYCLPAIADMLVDDIFGVTGSEKEAEGYSTSMREVKGNKSFDSYEILAKYSSVEHLGVMIAPIKNLLHELSTLKLLKKVDEVLRRITLGVQANEAGNSREMLVFAYNVFQSSLKAEVVVQKSTESEARAESRKFFELDIKPKKHFIRDHYVANASKLTRFALDTLRSVLTRNDELMTEANLAGFIPLIGDCMLSESEELQISALRLLNLLLRVQMSAIDEGADVFVAQAFSFVKTSPSTNSEICQASLKFLATVLKDRKGVDIKESQLAYILKRIKPDLEEPDRQGVTFTFIRSVLSRKFIIPEVYDVMDTVATMMVTNQTRSARDVARSTYFQFLMDYPQGKGRLKAQIAFLVRNLSYEHQSGRQSVMEVLHLILSKFGDVLVQEVVGSFFVALVMVLVNDDVAECREMAGALIQKCLQRADAERLTGIVKALRTWTQADDQPSLQRTGMQVYGLFFDVFKATKTDEMQYCVKRIRDLLSQSARATDEDAEDVQVSDTWEMAYYTLQTLSKIATTCPETVITKKGADIWSAVRQHLLYRHSWVRLSAARLIGALFAQCKAAPTQLPVEISGGLKFSLEDLIEVARKSLIQMRSPQLSEDLGFQAIKNLIFVGRAFYGSQAIMPATDADADEEETEDAAEGKAGQVVTCLSWMMTRLSAELRRERRTNDRQALSKRLMLQWYATMINIIQPTDLEPHVKSILRPLYRFSELPDINTESKELKSLSQEIMSLLQGRVGVTSYVHAFNHVKQDAFEKRQDRRHKRSLQQVAEPELAAKKKMKHNLQKKEQRKKKSLQFKLSRGG